MPMLTPSAVHIDQPLSNLTLAYVQEQTNFIADKCSPLWAYNVSRTSTTSMIVRI